MFFVRKGKMKTTIEGLHPFSPTCWGYLRVKHLVRLKANSLVPKSRATDLVKNWVMTWEIMLASLRENLKVTDLGFLLGLQTGLM